MASAKSGGDVYWLEGRPVEQGRYVVVRGQADGTSVDVTPPFEDGKTYFNVRTRVYEYGGGAWLVDDGVLYFSNFSDGRLYRQDRGGMPRPLTPPTDGKQPQPIRYYADGVIDRVRKRWIGVLEDWSEVDPNNEVPRRRYPTHSIAEVDLAGGRPNPGTPLVTDHDFFASPRLSPDGQKLVWLAWDHPRMPWQGTTLYLAELDSNGCPMPEPVVVAGGPEESILQPEWPPDGTELWFISDRSGWRQRVLKKATDLADDPKISEHFTTVESITFPTKNGEVAFGLYHPPANAEFTGPSDEKPPLVVMSHGGPTAQASSTLNFGIQYWTSRGIAVLDVNYRGSSGFGRAYRDLLKESWGIVDVEDCINGARYLAESGAADSERSVITGGSAGGFTTLAVLTFHDYFRAGASYYGVGDLETLAKHTHKFESHYLDWLVGPYPEQIARYRERSPIRHVEHLSSPVIFLQGEEDRIVPPAQAEAMVPAIKNKNLPVGYLLFAGEQHGFRRADNIRRSIEAVHYFFAFEIFRSRLSFGEPAGSSD